MSVFSAVSVLLLVWGCEARSQVEFVKSGDISITGREIHELQNSSRFEVAEVVQVGNDRYSIPRAPYIRLAEVGKGTPTAYYQAWLELEAELNRDNGQSHKPSQYETKTVTASVSFLDTGLPNFPQRDSDWIRSDFDLEGLPDTAIWLDTRQCENDQAPSLNAERSMISIQAIWVVAETPLYLSCHISLYPTPNGRRSVSCFGGSERTLSDPHYSFYGGDTLDQGCRAALERLVASFAYLPLIVDDWRSR